MEEPARPARRRRRRSARRNLIGNADHGPVCPTRRGSPNGYDLPAACLAIYAPAVALTSRDLDQIRQIIREELAAAAIEVARAPAVGQDGDPVPPESGWAHEEALRIIADMGRKACERAARPIPDGPYLSSDDAARLADTDSDTIVAWVRAGKLTKLKDKGRLRINRTELEALIAVRRRK